MATVGIDIRGRNRDLLEAIAGSKAALSSLRDEQRKSTGFTRQQAFEQRNLSRALAEQKRSLGALTGQWVSLRKALLTLGLRTAILGFASLTSSISAVANAAVGLTASVGALGASLAVLGGGAMMALGQGLIVVATGFKGVWKALTTTGDAQQKALAKLTKEGRSFVAFMGTMKVTFQDIQKLSQKGMFPGLERGMKAASKGFGDLKQVVFDTAKVVGYIGEKFGNLFGSRHADFKNVMERNVITLRRFGDAAVNITGALLGVFKAAGPFIGHVTAGIVTFTKTLDKAANSQKGQHSLASFFREMRVEWDAWTSIIGKTGVLIFNVLKAALPAQHKMEGAIGSTLDKWVKWTGSTKGQNFLGKFFNETLAPLGAFAQLLGDVVKDWTILSIDGAKNATRFWTGLKDHVLPVITDLAKTLNDGLFPAFMGLSGAIVDLIRDSILPGIRALSPAFRTVTELTTSMINFFDSVTSRLPGVLKLLALGGAIFAWGKFRYAISLATLEMRRFLGVAAEGSYLKAGIGNLMMRGGRVNSNTISDGGGGPAIGVGGYGGRGPLASAGPKIVYMSQPGFGLGSPPGSRRYAVPGANNIIGRYRDVTENRGVGLVTTGNQYLGRRDQLGTHGPKRLYGAAANPGTYAGAIPTGYRLTTYPGYQGFRNRGRITPDVRAFPTTFEHRRSPSTLRGKGALAAYEEAMYGPNLNAGPERSQRVLGRVTRGTGAVTSAFRGGAGVVGGALSNPIVMLLGLIFGPQVISSLSKQISTHNNFNLPKNGGVLNTLQHNVPVPFALLQGKKESAGMQQLKGFGDSADGLFKSLKKIGGAEGSEGLARLAHRAEDLAKTRGLEKFSDDLNKFGDAVNKAIYDRALPAFASMQRVGGMNIQAIRQRVADTSFDIQQNLGYGSDQGKKALSHNFQLAMLAVKKSMKSGVVSTKTGMQEIAALMRQNLALYGINGKQATRYLNGQDTLTGKSDASTNSGKAGAARGALYQVGRPGEGGRDDVPTMLNGKPTIVARGENIAVFNRHQRAYLDSRLAADGGLKGVFSKVNKPNHMAKGGFVNSTGAHVDTPGERAIAGNLDKMGRNMGIMFYPAGPRSARRTPAENAAVGGAQGSNHLRGMAMDVAPEIIKTIANQTLHGFDLNRPMPGNWRDDAGRIHDERNHIELFNGIAQIMSGVGAGSGVLSGIKRAILKKVRAKGVSGTLGRIVQGSLDVTRGAAQKLLNSISNPGNAHAFGGSSEAKKFAKGRLGQFGWDNTEWSPLLSLWNQESGWDPRAINKSSGAYGIPQSLGHGHPYDLGDYAAQVMWGLRYIKGRYGSPSSAWAHEQSAGWYSKGGMVDFMRASGGVSIPGRDDGVPDTPPETIPGDVKKKTGAKTKKKISSTRYPSGPRPRSTPYGTGLLHKNLTKAQKAKLKNLKKIKLPKGTKRLGRRLPFDLQGPLVDPLTGEAIDISKIELIKPIQALIDGYGKGQTSLSQLQDEHGLTDENAIVNGVINWDGMTDPGDGKFYGGINQHVAELNAELGLSGTLDNGQGIYGMIQNAMAAIHQRIGFSDDPSVLGASPELAISQRRARLKKIKTAWQKARNVHKATAKKLKNMQHGTYTWQSAVHDNEILLRHWRDYKLTGQHLPQGYTNGVTEIMNRIRDTNIDLKKRRPRGGDSMQAAQYTHDYKQSGKIMGYLTGDPDNIAWNPSGGLAGKMITSMDQWQQVADWRDSSMISLGGDGHSTEIAIKSMIKEIGDWQGTVAPKADTSNIDSLNQTIKDQMLQQHAIDQAQFNTIAQFAPLVGQRLIGAFAHGGPITETGMALVHRGEYILPDPQGPYRTGMNAPQATTDGRHIELNLHGDLGNFWRKMEVVIDDRVEKVIQNKGRKSRLIASSGG